VLGATEVAARSDEDLAPNSERKNHPDITRTGWLEERKCWFSYCYARPESALKLLRYYGDFLRDNARYDVSLQDYHYDDYCQQHD
jgi:hypothetical protein